MKLLFVCTANIDRGPTAEDLYKNQPGFEAQSAGTEEGYAKTLLTKEMIDWSDVVFCMEPKHRRKVLKLNKSAMKKIVILDIPDIYYKGHPILVEIIKERVQLYITQRKGCQK